MSSVRLGDTFRVAFGTSSPTTGAATDVDSGVPTVTVREQGTDLGYSPTVTHIATGEYEVAIVCTTANGFDTGKEYTARVSATVGGITGKDGLAAFTIDGTGREAWNYDIIVNPGLGNGMGQTLINQFTALAREYTPLKPFKFYFEPGGTGGATTSSLTIGYLLNTGTYVNLTVTTDYTLVSPAGENDFICTFINGLPAGVAYFFAQLFLSDGTDRYQQFALIENPTAVAVWQAKTSDHYLYTATGQNFADMLATDQKSLTVEPNTSFSFILDPSTSETTVGISYYAQVTRGGTLTALTYTTDYTVTIDTAGGFCVTILAGLPAGQMALYYFEADYASGNVAACEVDVQVLGSGIHGTAVTGTLTTTAFSTSITATAADQFKDCLVRFTTGANKGQIKRIGASTTGANSVFTLKTGYAFTSSPTNLDPFEIVNG